MKIQKNFPRNAAELIVIGCFALFTQVFGGLQPYYLNFPPPVLTVPNGIDGDFTYSAFPHRPTTNVTLSRNGNLPSGPIPLILHTWIKPDSSEGTKLQNGTVIYYLGGPWGGIRSSSPTDSTEKPQSHFAPVSNNALSEQGYSSTPVTGGWKPPTIDITTPPATRQQTGPWGHGHLGFGWPSSTQLYDKIPITTTMTAPTRNQSPNNGTNGTSTTTTTKRTTTTARSTTSTKKTKANNTRNNTPTTTTPNPNSRYPVSDSVRKFRRIITQIRAITRKELGAEAREARREQRRRERLLRNRSNY